MTMEFPSAVLDSALDSWGVGVGLGVGVEVGGRPLLVVGCLVAGGVAVVVVVVVVVVVEEEEGWEVDVEVVGDEAGGEDVDEDGTEEADDVGGEAGEAGALGEVEKLLVGGLVEVVTGGVVFPSETETANCLKCLDI